MLLSVPTRDAFLYSGEGGEREGLLAPTFSIAYSSAITGEILFKFNMYAVALGKFSEHGVMTFKPIREVTYDQRGVLVRMITEKAFHLFT